MSSTRDALERLAAAEADNATLRAEVAALQGRVGAMVGALQAMLKHSCVADSAPEDKDGEDHDAERMAWRALATDGALEAKVLAAAQDVNRAAAIDIATMLTHLPHKCGNDLRALVRALNALCQAIDAWQSLPAPPRSE